MNVFAKEKDIVLLETLYPGQVFCLLEHEDDEMDECDCFILTDEQRCDGTLIAVKASNGEIHEFSPNQNVVELSVTLNVRLK